MNNLLKEIQSWQKKPAERRGADVFIIEGIKMFSEAPANRIQTVAASEGFLKNVPGARALVEKKRQENPKLRFLTVKDEEFSRISDLKTPQGILAVLSAYHYDLQNLFQEKNGLFVFLENLQDPGNLGTVIRSSEAAGASGVIMSEGCADIYNPKVIRSTMGSLFRVPFVTVPDLLISMESFHRAGGKTYAAHLKASESYREFDYKEMTAFLIGNESRGLSDAVSEAASAYIKIPMQGRVESLNAAMAATILLYEAAGQRDLKR